MKHSISISTSFLLLLIGGFTFAQDMVGTTRVSQRASVIQRIGTTDVTVVYHSPLAKGRKIFGGIVPYNFVVDGKEYPWRAGSNRNTTIEFTHDVKIEGKELKAGSYGLHILVFEKKWTVIFSNNYESWGSFQYDAKDDALRVDVVPETVTYQEWLSYNFVDREAESAKVELIWATKRVRFEISVDVNNNLLKDLQAKEDKTAREYVALAREELKKNASNHEAALAWLEESIKLESNFQNKMMKADLLDEMGKKKEAKSAREEGLSLAQGFDWYYYGLSKYLLKGDKKESYKILSKNVKDNPENWIAHLALGEYYIKEDNQSKVVEHFAKAFEYAPDNWRNYARYLYLSNKLILEN